MITRSVLVGTTLAAATATAFATTPVRTPGTYAVKTNTPGTNPHRVTQISLDKTHPWDHDSFVRTTFNNRPDAQGRGNPTMTFNHQNGALISNLNFSSTTSAAGANATLQWRRVGTGGTFNENRSAGPDANGTTALHYRFNDALVSADMFFYAARTGYWDVLRSGGYYGAGGFFNVPGEYRSGHFSGGMTTFRFENNQDVGTARMLYNFANDGGENGTVRARLLYLDRNGEDGYNKIRFTYVSNPTRPVSPH